MGSSQVRYQVFVSSTFTDLAGERQAVISSLLQLDAIPAGMELFPAADEDAWSLIANVIQDSDYYLLVVGGRYGSTAEDGLSFTEREYDLAVSLRKPVMAFLHGAPDEIPAGKTDKDDALSGKLAAFRTKVESAKHVKFWTSAEQLAGQVALTFASFVRSYPAVGWIRADQAASSDLLQQVNDLRRQNDELAAIGSRSQIGPPPAAAGLAQGTEQFAAGMDLSFEFAGDAPVREESAGGRRQLPPVQSLRFVLLPTWDEILESIGATLLFEASEGEMRQRLVTMLVEQHEDKLASAVRAWLADAGYDFRGEVRNFKGDISESDFARLIAQLVSLGHVEKNDRQRSVKDRQTYWRLTPYGEATVLRLLAIESGDAPSPDSKTA